MLPPEIFEHIFSFLQSDPSTLRTCCDALPALAKLVEGHLYALIIVHNFEPVNSHSFTPSQLVNLLSDNPRIARYVRTLHVVVKWPTYFHRRMRSFNETAMSSIFALFPRLENILLWSRGVSWNLLQDNFVSAFSDCVRSRPITDVYVCGFLNFPLSSFNDCTHLKTLALDGSFTSPPNPKLCLFELDSLSIHHCSKSSLPAIRSFRMLSKLSSLDFRIIRSDDLEVLRSVLHTCSQSLTSLELGFGKEFEAKNDNADQQATVILLHLLPFLEKLTLHASMNNSPEILLTGPSPRIITRILQDLPPSLKLMTLHFYFHFGTSFPVFEIDWTRLTLLPYLPKFHPIPLRISAINDYVPVPPDEVLVMLEKSADLMRMVRQGILVVRAEDSRFRRNILNYETGSHAYSRPVFE